VENLGFPQHLKTLYQERCGKPGFSTALKDFISGKVWALKGFAST